MRKSIKKSIIFLLCEDTKFDFLKGDY